MENEADKAILEHLMHVEHDSLLTLSKELSYCNANLPIDQNIAKYVIQNILTGDYEGGIDNDIINTWDTLFWRIGICVFAMNTLHQFPGATMARDEMRSFLKECERMINNGNEKETP